MRGEGRGGEGRRGEGTGGEGREGEEGEKAREDGGKNKKERKMKGKGGWRKAETRSTYILMYMVTPTIASTQLLNYLDAIQHHHMDEATVYNCGRSKPSSDAWNAAPYHTWHHSLRLQLSQYKALT